MVLIALYRSWLLLYPKMRRAMINRLICRVPSYSSAIFESRNSFSISSFFE